MTTRSQRSRLYRLIEQRLDGTLLEFVAARWPYSGWRKISAEIEELTGIEVSNETLRAWFADRIEGAAYIRTDAQAAAS